MNCKSQISNKSKSSNESLIGNIQLKVCKEKVNPKERKSYEYQIREFQDLQEPQSQGSNNDNLLKDKANNQQKKILKWNKDKQYEIINVNRELFLQRRIKDMNGIITSQEFKIDILSLNKPQNIAKKQLKKIISQIEKEYEGVQNLSMIKLLGGGTCSGKQRKPQQQKMKQMVEKKQSILLNEFQKSEKKQDKIIEEYTYQMNEEQLENVNLIIQKLHFKCPADEVTSRYVSALFLEIYDFFNLMLSKGILSTQAQQIFQQLLEGGVNFLLSLIYCAEKQKCHLFDDKMKIRVIEKIKKTLILFKKYETRLPLQVGIFLLKYQKKIVQLKRKQVVDSPSNKILKLEAQATEWDKQYIRFCFGGFQDVDFNHLQNLITSLQIYYEYNKNQKFVVELLKTQLNIIKKYADVVQKNIQFEEYFETILKDYENKEFCSIFYSYIMLFDQIFDCCKNLGEADNSNLKMKDYTDLAAHFIKLVTGNTFIELCRRTFYYENLKHDQTRRIFINSLEENYFLRYVELKILIQTYKLIKIFEEKNKLSEWFSGIELNHLQRLEIQIFEKFLQESSCEVNCLIYDDEQLLKLIEHLNTQIDDSYFQEFRLELRGLKQNLEKLIINSVSSNDNEKVNPQKEQNMIQQLLGRKINFSLVMNDPKSAISNRFIEAFINRVESKNNLYQNFISFMLSIENDSLHEKGSTIHVNQRLKFISNNSLSKTEVNVDGLVEDSLSMLEKYFLVESNTTINVVAIKGGPGMGKTHLCRELMRRLMKKIQDTGSRNIAIPIMVEMIEVENISAHQDLESFLNSSIERYAFRSHKELTYLKNSTIPKVIILDGLSEWSWGSPSTSFRDWIRLREWQNTKLIITYRRPFVRAEEFPYFFGQKCKQPHDVQENETVNQNGAISRDASPNKKFPNLFAIDAHQQINTFQEDDREKCFEVFQILSLSQDNVEDYFRQKEEQVRFDVKGKQRKGSMSLDSSMMSNANIPQPRNRSLSVIRDIEPGFLINTFRACTRKNTHLIDMLELPFNLFCFAEILSKVQGLKEIYWGGGGTKEERRAAAAWFLNQEEMQEKLFIEEVNGLIAEADIEEELRPLCNENVIEFFQSLAMNLFVTRKFKVTLREMKNLITQQMKTILKSGGTKPEITSFEKSLICIIQNISRTSFLASNDISFFQFVTGANSEENDSINNDIQSMKEFELNFPMDKGPGQHLPATSQLYSFRNTPWLEFMIARAMKYDFDKFGNSLHSMPLQDMQKFAINTRYLLEERSVSEHNPFSISQQTNHASIEMNILKKLSTIIRKDLLNEDFQNKLGQKDIAQQHRYIQMIQRTKRRPRKYYEQKNPQPVATKQHFLQETKPQNTVEEWVIKHQKHPLDIASSNILSAICVNKLSLGLIKLRNCSFSRAYLYGYRGDMDIACSDVSESNLRGSSIVISRSKFQHCLLDDEKNNHERWNSSYTYTYSALHFADNSKLICGSFNGGLSVFQPKSSISNSKVQAKKKDPKKDKDNNTNTLQVIDPSFQPMQFWNLTSFQRQFQEEVRAVATYKGDIYYAFLNIIAHVTENGEEKELVIGHQNKINDMCISELHSTLCTVSSDHTIRIWKIVNPDLKDKNKKQEQKLQQKPQQQQQQQLIKPKVGYTALAPQGSNGQFLEIEEVKDDENLDIEESFAEMELLHTLNRHDAEVVCCSYSPNGLYLATGSYDEVVYVWDIKSKYLKTVCLTIKNDWITSIQFSNDSSLLVAGSSQSFIKIWDATKPDLPMVQQISTRKQRRDSIILGNTQNKNDCIGGISCVRISPNGKLLLFSTYDEPGISVYELAKGSNPKQYKPSNGKKIIYLDESVMGQDYTTRRMPYFLVNQMTFSPDGKLLAVSSSSQTLCSIWNIDQNYSPPKQATRGDSASQLIAPSALKINSVLSPNKVAAMAVTHDGRYIATCAGLASPHKDSCRITIWCIMKRGEQGIIMQTLDAGLHSQAVSSLCFSPDNSFLVSASEDDHFVVWKNVSTQPDPMPLLQLSRQNSSFESRRQSGSVLFNRHGSINQFNMNHFMYLEPFKRVSAHKQPISAISFSIDCRFLVTASAKEKSCKVWDGHTFDFSHQIQWEEEIAISQLEFSTNGLYLATLPLPSVVTSTVSAVYQNRKGSKKLTVQRKQSILIQNSNQPNLVHQQSSSKPMIPQAQNQVQQVQSRSSCCFLWNASDRFSYYGIVGTVKSKEGRAFQTQIISMSFSKDSALFATGQTNGLCNIWDVQNRFHLIQSIDAHFSSINHLAFSSDSQILASTSFDQTCKIWHVPNRFHEISSFYIPLETSGIQFVRQGHSIAVGSTSDEFSIKFVDVFAPNYRMEELRAHSSVITQTTFSNDGRFLLTASQDNTVRIWDLKNHFYQHYTINLNFRQNINQKENQINTLSKQEQNQEDNQKEQKQDVESESGEEQKEETDRYKQVNLSPIKKNKSKMKHDIYLSMEDLDAEEDGILETEQDTADNKKLNLNQNQPTNKRTQKRKLSSFAAPNLKPSQVYQNKIKEIHKDESVEEQDYDTNAGGIVAAAISDKGTFVFVVTKEESNYVLLYDLTRGVDDVRESIILKDHSDQITCLALSIKDEYLATGCANTEIKIWKRTSLSSLTCEFELEKFIEGRHTKQISCLAFSPNLKYFASGSWDITCKVFDVQNNFQLIHSLDGQYGYILSLAFSPCSSRLSITSRDFSCNVWDLDNRLVEEELFDHRQAVSSCSYSPQYLATASKDESFILYDIKDHYKIARKIENLPSPVTNCCLSPDGKYLVVGLQNSLVQVWDILNIYDLTLEIQNDFYYKQACKREIESNQEQVCKVKVGQNICNFMSEDDLNEDNKIILNDGETLSDYNEMVRQIPQMKKDIIGNILKNSISQYKEINNLQFDVNYTDDGHILVIVPKYPMCVVSL